MKIFRLSPAVWSGLTLCYMTGLMLASFPSNIIPGESTLFKKFIHNSVHIPAYAILTFLIWKSFNQKFLPMAVLSAFTYGLLIEIVQMFVPGRTASILDACLNAVGIGTAVFVINKITASTNQGRAVV